MNPQKSQIRKLLLRELKKQHEISQKALDVATAATTHADAKSEGKYDTRAIETGYLAGATANRLREIEGKIHFLTRLQLKNFDRNAEITLTSMVRLGESWFFILSHLGGIAVEVDGEKVFAITPDSKMGTNLMGCYIDDEIDGKVIQDHY